MKVSQDRNSKQRPQRTTVIVCFPGYLTYIGQVDLPTAGTFHKSPYINQPSRKRPTNMSIGQYIL